MISRDSRARTSTLEWIAAAIGLVLLLGVIGIIGREALLGETGQPPAITVAATRIVPLETGYLVEFEATNLTSGTAASVTIEGKLDGPAPETASATLDYVAGHASTTGGLFFTRDPRGPGALQLRALGYQQP